MTVPLSTRLRFRLALWLEARLLPFRVPRKAPLAEVLALAEDIQGTPYAGLSADYILHRVRKVTRGPWMMRDRRCLRQGILAYRFLTAAGFRPALHFGIERDSVHGPRLSAHCWIVQDGAVVLNPPSPGMVPIHVHPPLAARPAGA